LESGKTRGSSIGGQSVPSVAKELHMPLDSISLLPVVVGSPVAKIKLRQVSRPFQEQPEWWIQCKDCGVPSAKVYGPLTKNDVLEMVDLGEIDSNSLLCKAWWPAWERVHRSRSLVWVFERAELFSLKKINNDIELEASFFNEAGDSLWGYLAFDDENKPQQSKHLSLVPLPKFEAKAIGVRRNDGVGSLSQIAALLLAVCSGVAVWASQLPKIFS